MPRRANRSDRDARAVRVLNSSGSTDEALLKRCAHFDLDGASGVSATPLGACKHVVRTREAELADCERDIGALVGELIKQRDSLRSREKGCEPEHLTHGAFHSYSSSSL